MKQREEKNYLELIDSEPDRQGTPENYFRQVKSRWDDRIASDLDPVERLVYRSNLLGFDAYINNTGGGNTSSKLAETDPLTGRSVEVLWVKGSGGDLRTASPSNFASLYQEKLLALQSVYASFEKRGPKSAAEDSMVGYYPHCTFNLNPRAPSIDTPLHSFIPSPFVDHTHPVPIIALATADNGEELTEQIFGGEVAWVEWMRPGFELGLKLQETIRSRPKIRGIILGGHGLINWADGEKECYEISLELINRASSWLSGHEKGLESFGGAKFGSSEPEKREELLIGLLPWLRGEVSRERRFIGTVQSDELTLQFVNSNEAERLAALGTSCPDHFLRTKIKPLYVEWDPGSGSPELLRKTIRKGLERYRNDYRAYYEEYGGEPSPPMRDPNPTVILIPGLGMITWGKNKSESRVTAEFYTAAIGVMRGAESIGSYTALPRQEAYDIEYWELEEAKLRRMPPESELSRNVAVVVGGGSGIGKALVSRLVREGAAVAVLDLNGEAASRTADAELERIGSGIGVAGSGISRCGDLIGLECDITDRESVRRAFGRILIAYGGIDRVAVTAGLFPVPGPGKAEEDNAWEKSFSVNVKGAHIVGDEAAAVWERQRLGGALVFTTSVNAVVPKAGSMAYDTCKAAANHLVRELAVRLAPSVRVNGVAPATVVEGSGMFPRDRVIESLRNYEVSFDESESTEELRNRLARFYSGRTLLRRPITPGQQAEAIFLLLGERLENTTGQIVTVDGGLKEAFLR